MSIHDIGVIKPSDPPPTAVPARQRRADDEPLRVGRLDLSDERACRRYFRFRTDHFRGRLGWDVLNGSGVDCDDLDAISTHFVLSRGCGEVVGCIRLTPPAELGWMIDSSPFAEIVDRTTDPAYPRAQAAEVSRFGIAPRFALTRDSAGYTGGRALRKMAYQQSLRLGLRYWYVVAYKALVRSLQRHDHLPLRIVSPSVFFDDRFATCVACLDLAEAYVRMARRAPDFLQWNNEGVPTAHLAVLMEDRARSAGNHGR